MCTPEKARQGLIEIAVQAHNRKEKEVARQQAQALARAEAKRQREQEHGERVKRQREQVVGRPVEPWKGHWAHQTSKKI